MCKNFLLFILLISSVNLFAQNYIQYYNLVNEAEYWMYKREYENARQLYLKAFDLEKPMSKDAYLLAKCYALDKKKKEALYWLEQSAQLPMSFVEVLLKNTQERINFQVAFSEDGELEAIRQDLIFLKQRADKKHKGAKYKLLQDTTLVFSIQHMKSQGQIKKQEETPGKLALAKQEDSILQHNFLKLIQEQGYPGFVTVGHGIANTILMHIQDNVYTAYKEVLHSELQKGNIYPRAYAFFLESKHLRVEKSCYFYIENYTNDLCTPSDYEAIVKRRLEIGFSIYFPGTRSLALEAYDLHPWVTDEFVVKHSLLDK